MEMMERASEYCPAMTGHATARANGRSISPEAIDLALTYGKRVRKRGAIIFYLGRRHIPQHLLNDAKKRRMEGTTVLMSSDEGAIITVYRNRRGIR